ncbi:MAG: ABC transporter substrate-binding protein [Actinomycetota bacterium]
MARLPSLPSTTTGRHRRTLGVAVLALALVATACSGGSEGDELGFVEDSAEGTDGGPAADPNGDGVLQVGIMGECEGPFGAYHEDVVSGVVLAMVERAGATPGSTTSALDGFTDASVAGVDIELVGIACGDDTAETALAETTRLVEELGAEVVIGPLSGDESIAMATYALEVPDVTFINGAAGAQETTLKIQAPNYFRFNGDGAQWNAGLGDAVRNTAGWDTVAVVADDYSFGNTSAAGFIAEFCAAGGTVIHRAAPELGATDYTDVVAALPDPDEVDGYFWAVGGTGTAAILDAFVADKGEIDGAQHAGNIFFNAGLADSLGPGIAGAWIGGFASLPADVTSPEIEAYILSANATWATLPGGLTGNESAAPATTLTFGFAYTYYIAAIALIEAIEATGGDLDPAALRTELSFLTLDGPYGEISLDENRQAIVENAVKQMVIDDVTGEVVERTVAIVPGVDQTFGGLFSPGSPSPSPTEPACIQGDLPWIGQAVPVVDGVRQR